MKVVLDTNVLLAAFGTRGLCGAVLGVCLAGHELVLSQPILDEFRRNIIAKFKAPPDHAARLVAFLRTHARSVEPVDVPTAACRDRNDLPILGTAAAAKADCLVTGDADLLKIGQFHGTAILSPRAFYDLLALRRG